MSDIEVFELDDDFDPLEDEGFTNDEEIEQVRYDYLPPIPDAGKSVVSAPVELTSEEKLARLIVSIPGQKFRILRAISLCTEPQSISQVSEVLDVEFPSRGSVYDTGRIMELLEKAGGLEKMPACEQEKGTETPAPVSEKDLRPGAWAENDVEYLTVQQKPPTRYRATDCGLALVDANSGIACVADMLSKEPQYLPIYERILELAASEDGCSVTVIGAAVDSDPRCQNPRRISGYFLNKLENVAALRWRGTWQITEVGRQALASSAFAV